MLTLWALPLIVVFFGGGGGEALRSRQQCFSHARTEPPVPGYYQYFLGGKCILLL